MSLTPVTFQRFGALNVADDPHEVGPEAAVNALNVDFDRPGRVRCRSGYSRVKALTMTTPQDLASFETSAGTRQFVVGYANGATKKYEAYASTGGAAVASATPTATGISAARIGTPSNEYLYLANGADTVWRWTGAAFSQPAGMPAATYLTTKPNSNRLVAANITGTSISRVQFSDAGAAETWTASSFVDLMPGDGSGITGLATWRDDVYAFKRGRFFVFGPEGSSGTGNPVFGYRTVDGSGAIIPPAAGDDGVYFFDGRTVWVTQGGVPRRVSTSIEPFLRGDADINGNTVDQAFLSGSRMFYSLGRLYFSVYVGATPSRETLVYDPRMEAWTVYGTEMYAAVTLNPASTDLDRTFWLSASGVESFDGRTTDNGADIGWLWTSGKYPLDPQGRLVYTQGMSLSGTGFITLAIDSDVYPSQQTGSAVVADLEGWLPNTDQEGRWFQHTVSGSLGGEEVTSVTHYVQSVGPAGEGGVEGFG